MSKKIIKQVIINQNTPATPNLSTAVTAFYADVIRRRLTNSNLSKEAKQEVLSRVTENLKERIT